MVKKLRPLILLLLIFSAHALAAVLDGKVVHVADGDSIVVLADKVQYKVRLGAIDAPERFQAYGKRSKQSLAALIAGRNVRVQYDKLDRYGRIVGKVLLQNQDVGLEQVKRGMAWFYRHYQHELTTQDRSAYDATENKARRERRGLWAAARPTPPWIYRRQHPRT